MSAIKNSTQYSYMSAINNPFIEKNQQLNKILGIWAMASLFICPLEGERKKQTRHEYTDGEVAST
jgi:hypothetical protein